MSPCSIYSKVGKNRFLLPEGHGATVRGKVYYHAVRVQFSQKFLFKFFKFDPLRPEPLALLDHPSRLVAFSKFILIKRSEYLNHQKNFLTKTDYYCLANTFGLQMEDCVDQFFFLRTNWVIEIEKSS